MSRLMIDVIETLQDAAAVLATPRPKINPRCSFLGYTDQGMWVGYLVQVWSEIMLGGQWCSVIYHPEPLHAALVSLWRHRREFPACKYRLVRA